MLELFWLLLPIAAASGWVVARYRLLPKTRHSSINLSSDYFKGLSYLLNEQPDKAIDIFIKLIDVDNETIETHLALGVLFRRQGEVNRAILIHQNLIERPTLSAQQRYLALLELAQDYRRAGLLDRAEDLFQELILSNEYRVYAYRQLLDIYEQEHDWEKAINTAKKLAIISENNLETVIAQYYCEQADFFTQQRQYQTALQTLQLALEQDVNCVRASLLMGYIFLAEKEFNQAIIAFRQIEQQDSDYLPEIIEPLQQCYQAIDKTKEFTVYLQHILIHYGGTTPVLILAEILLQTENAQQAADFVVKQLHKRPSIRGLDYLIDLALVKRENISHEHLLLIKDMTTELLKNKPIYKCSQCGFTGKSLHWQCPSCKQWNTIRPIQGIDGE